jgi:O-antigen/teichoic acid export membrane protein
MSQYFKKSLVYLFKILFKFNLKPTSEFVKNSFLMINSSIIVQVISISAAPLLTRIYLPDDFGTFALITAFVSLIGVFSTFGYANALLVSSVNEVEIIKKFCVKSVIIISLLTFLAFYVYESVLRFYDSSIEICYFYIIPLLVLLSGLISIYSNILIRKNNFKIISIFKILTSITNVILTCIFGFLLKSFVGLVIGIVFSQLLGCIFLFIYSKKNSIESALENNQKFSANHVLKSHRHFALYGMPTSFINSLLNQLPIFAINFYFTGSLAAVGSYNMTNRILGLPVVLVSTSIGEVFKQRANVEYHENGSCREIYLKTLKSLFFLSIIPFTIIFIYGPSIFEYLFGIGWRDSGQYARILGPMFFLRFIVSPLSSVFIIAKRQQMDMLLHLAFLFLGIASFYVGLSNFKSIIVALAFYSSSYSLIYLIYMLLSYKFSEK